MGEPFIWPHAHGPDCCERAPEVGARYRKMMRDIWTHEELGYAYFTVIAVDPFRRHHFGFCRRVHFRKDDDGWVGACHPQHFLKDYEAVENVVSFPTPKDEP